MLNLASNLARSAFVTPEKTAIRFTGKSYTYAQLDALSSQIANGLKSIGIEPGDKVALGCPNLPYFPMVYYGILKMGAVVVPLNVLLKGREIAYHLQDLKRRPTSALKVQMPCRWAKWGGKDSVKVKDVSTSS